MLTREKKRKATTSLLWRDTKLTSVYVELTHSKEKEKENKNVELIYMRTIYNNNNNNLQIIPM